jgi:hypothetical protein
MPTLPRREEEILDHGDGVAPSTQPFSSTGGAEQEGDPYLGFMSPSLLKQDSPATSGALYWTSRSVKTL